MNNKVNLLFHTTLYHNWKTNNQIPILLPKQQMKKTLSTLTSLLLLLALVLSFAACPATDPWADAIYTEDTTLGEGAVSFTFEVVCGEHKVTFTVNTDEEMLGDALLELGLIAGDEGPYGLYVKRVNGVLADYDVDGYFWALYVNGTGAMVGVDSTPVEASAVYRFAREK